MTNKIAAENGDPSLRANRSAVAHWVAGVQPRPATAAYLVEVLARRLGRPLRMVDLGLASGVVWLPEPAAAGPVAAITVLGRADVDRRRLVNNAVYSIGALLIPITGPEPAARSRGCSAARNGGGGARVRLRRFGVHSLRSTLPTNASAEGTGAAPSLNTWPTT